MPAPPPHPLMRLGIRVSDYVSDAEVDILQYHKDRLLKEHELGVFEDFFYSTYHYREEQSICDYLGVGFRIQRF